MIKHFCDFCGVELYRTLTFYIETYKDKDPVYGDLKIYEICHSCNSRIKEFVESELIKRKTNNDKSNN